jgi:hypothetical protein
VLTIDRLVKLKGVIKWNAVFGEAGLNPNTMRSAVHHHRELRAEEAVALVDVLSRYGLSLTEECPGTSAAGDSDHPPQRSRSSPSLPVATHG